MVPREAKNHGIPKIVVIARSMLYSTGSYREARTNQNIVPDPLESCLFCESIGRYVSWVCLPLLQLFNQRLRSQSPYQIIELCRGTKFLHLKMDHFLNGIAVLRHKYLYWKNPNEKNKTFYQSLNRAKKFSIKAPV